MAGAHSPVKPFAYAAVLLVLCTFFGCSTPYDVDSRHSPGAQFSPQYAPRTIQDIGKVRILVYGDAEDDAELYCEQQTEVFRLVAEALEQQYCVRMELSFIRSDRPFLYYNSIEDRLAAMVAEGDPPEIVYRTFPPTIDLLINNFLPCRLNDLIDAYGGNLTRWLPGEEWEQCMIGDDIYGIPSTRRLHPQFLAVDNGLLARHGWQVPTTFAQFQQLLDDASAAGIQPLPGYTGYQNWFGLPRDLHTTLLCESGKGELMPVYESENYLRYLETLHRWVMKGYILLGDAEADEQAPSLFDRFTREGDVTMIAPLAAGEAEPLSTDHHYPAGQFEAYSKPEALVILSDWVLSTRENYALMVYGQHEGTAPGSGGGMEQATPLRSECFFHPDMDDNIKKENDGEYAGKLETIAAYQRRAERPPPYYRLPYSCWRFARGDSELWLALRSQQIYESEISNVFYRCIFEKKPLDYFKAALLENRPYINRYIQLATLYKQGLYDPAQDMVTP